MAVDTIAVQLLEPDSRHVTEEAPALHLSEQEGEALVHFFTDAYLAGRVVGLASVQKGECYRAELERISIAFASVTFRVKPGSYLPFLDNPYLNIVSVTDIVIAKPRKIVGVTYFPS